VEGITLESTPCGTKLVRVSFCVSVYVIDSTSRVLTRRVLRVVAQVKMGDPTDVSLGVGDKTQGAPSTSLRLGGLQTAEMCQAGGLADMKSDPKQLVDGWGL
jgi:hypothetical protein